jgi:hypothetical protein
MICGAFVGDWWGLDDGAGLGDLMFWKRRGAELAGTRGSAAVSELGMVAYTVCTYLTLHVSRRPHCRRQVVLFSRTVLRYIVPNSFAIDAASAVKVSCVATGAKIYELSILGAPHSLQVTN